MKSAYLLIDSRGAEIQHRSGITAPDAFIYFQPDGEKSLVFFDAREYVLQKNKLEQLDNGVEIKPLEPYLAKTEENNLDYLIGMVLVLIKEYGVEKIFVSSNFPYNYGKILTDRGVAIEIYDYAREREKKKDSEIEKLILAQRVNESAFALAKEILQESAIRGQEIIYQDTVLTSQFLRARLRKHLLDREYDCPDGIIVSSGEQTAQPHNEGNGKILPNVPIIIDIFPRSETTGYFADMTRTFVKGTPSAQVKEIYNAVKTVQKEVLEKIAVGDKCADIHLYTCELFKKLGHPISSEKGFMHGTGHSLGLSLHEAPYLNARSQKQIEPGMVFTVEPGLYYPGVGGVRLEDVVVFHPDGQKENITRFDTEPFFF